MAAGTRQDTMQRIQVGVVGLVAVLLLVSVANFVLQRASEEQSAIEEIQEEAVDSSRAATGYETDDDAPPAEPLVEMGIQPAPAPEEGAEAAAGKAAAKNQRSRSERARSGRTKKEQAPKAQVVPDLKPDPKLDAPMDRER